MNGQTIDVENLNISDSTIEKTKQLLSSPTKNTSQKIELLKSLTDYYIDKKSNADSAIVYNKKINEFAFKEKDSLLYAIVYDNLARIGYLESDYEDLQKYAKDAIRIYTSEGKLQNAASVYRLLGNTFQVLFKNKEALSYLNIAEKNIAENEKALLYIGYAAVNAQSNNLDKAVSYYEKAYQIAQETNQEHLEYNIFNGLAVVYNKNGDTDMILTSFKKALEAAKKKDDYLAQVVVYHNMGYQYKQTGELLKSKETLENGIKLFNKTNNKFIIASTYKRYAEVLFELGDIDNAELELEKSSNIFKQLKNTGRLSSVLNLKAAIEKKKGNIKTSISLLKEAIAISEKNEIIGSNQKNYIDISKNYEILGEYETSLEFYKKYVTSNDSIISRKKKQNIEEQKLKFDIAEYEQNIKDKEQELVLLNSQKQTSWYRNILLGLISLGLLFFIYRQRKLNQTKNKRLEAEKEVMLLKDEKLQTEMKFKNTEITDFALQINERNKLLKSFTNKIKEVKKTADTPEQKSKLNELQMYISDHMEVNKEKVTLNTKVKETEESFVFNLKEAFPKLSPKEIQVATYLRLNLPSKQIATQMNIAEQSVNNYRRAIRKKMGLKKEDNLNEKLAAL